MNKLITKSLQSSKVSFLFRVPEVLLNELEKKILEWIRGYVLKFGVPPTVERLEEEFKFFLPEYSSDPLEDLFLLEMVTKKNIFVRTEISKNQEYLLKGGDPTELILNIASAINTSKVDAKSTANNDRSYYFKKKNIHYVGIPFIDETTGGVAGGDLVWVVGRPGSNKTTFAEWVIIHWMLEGKKVLYVSNENVTDDVLQKLDSFLGGWNPINYRTGVWSDEDKAKVEAVATLTPKLNGCIIVPSDPALSTTEVFALVEEYKPDVVLIDGVYLMSESKKSAIGWEDAAAVSRALKRLARKTGLPFIGVIQANREAEGQKVGRGTIAHTDAYLQDADIIVSLNKDQETKEVQGQIIKTRWGVTDLGNGFTLSFNFDTMDLTIKEDIVAITKTVSEDW